MSHPAFTKDSTAVVTGGASGIGLAIAKRFAGFGMRIVIADVSAERFTELEADLRKAGASGVLACEVDVSDVAQVQALEAKVTAYFGGADILVNNAGIGIPSSCFGDRKNWQALLGVNFNGVLNGCQVFGPGMLQRGRPGAIINTGSKQGITTPPGNPAYNVSKAALKAYTEALAHELRNVDGAKLTAHLLIPGFVYTGITGLDEKPPAAWTAEQTADFFINSINQGDFYILCPDNDVPRSLDEKRMAWAVGDIIENRPPLSRWHPDFADAFASFIDSKT